MTSDAVTSARLLQPPWDALTLPHLIRGAAMLRADATLFSEEEAPVSVLHRAPRRLTARAYLQACEATARKLIELGLDPGGRVITLVPNSIDAMIAIGGVMMAGGVPVMLPIFAEQAEIARVMALSGATGVLSVTRFAGMHPAKLAANAAIDHGILRFVAAFGEDVVDPVAGLDRWTLHEGTPALRLPAPAPADAACITIDRTDGQFVLLQRTHAQLLAEALTAVAACGVMAEGRVIATLPPVTMAGIALGLCAPLLSSSHVELIPLFDSCAFAAQLGSGARTVLVVPAGAEAALKHYALQRGQRGETLVFVHRPAAADAPRTPQLGAAERTIDAIWHGESFGVYVPRAVHPARRTAGGHPDVADERDALGYRLMARNRIDLTGPLAPTPVGAAAGGCETRFGLDILQAYRPGFAPMEQTAPAMQNLSRASA